MTEEQMSLMKKLIKKHGIGATDGEWLLVYLGVRYGLLEQQVDEYLTLDTTELLIKHEKMLCIILGVEKDWEDWDGRCVFLQKEQQKACRLPR